MRERERLNQNKTFKKILFRLTIGTQSLNMKTRMITKLVLKFHTSIKMYRTLNIKPEKQNKSVNKYL